MNTLYIRWCFIYQMFLNPKPLHKHKSYRVHYKDARFTKLKNILDQLISDDREGYDVNKINF